uniref:Uncharacterized LOC107742790 n=1 Tax=Sinocyclocheilus rhinocerous TaxID=307959 RepID=A0A673KAJ4_9TELE
MKKMFLKLVLFCLCLWGLVGRGALTPKDQLAEGQRATMMNLINGMIDKIWSVMEGDSFTLGSRLLKMKNNGVIQWRFFNTLLAIINKQTDSMIVFDDAPDGRFRDRLNLNNQTGSLTITNITAEHTGIYYLHINGPIRKTLYLNVRTKPLSVMEGDSVTLNSGLTKITDDDQIEWIFLLINLVEFNKRDDRITVYEDVLGGRFRDRLKLDKQTGSLTITNITTEHAGSYRLRRTGGLYSSKIISVSVYTRLPVPVISSTSSHCFSSSSSCSLVCSVVNVSHVTLSWYKGNSLLSSISASDLSISLSLPLEVEYQDKNSYSCVLNNPISNQTQHLDISQLCPKCSGDSNDIIPVIVKVGDSVTLNSGLTKFRNVDLIQWKFGMKDTLIAEMNILAGKVTVYNGPDGRFRGRLNVDHQTGSLTITNTTNEHSGHYRKEINGVIENMLLATQNEISVKKGDSVTLNSDVTEMMNDDLIQWTYMNENAFIAGIYKPTNSITVYEDALDGRFRDRLKLNNQTGSLTITNITTQHAGSYLLLIIG